MLGEIKKKEPSKHLLDYLEGQNIDVNSPLEKDNGLNINDLGKKEEVVEEKVIPQAPVNPAVAALQTSINKVVPKEEDVASKDVTPINTIPNINTTQTSNSGINQVSKPVVEDIKPISNQAAEPVVQAINPAPIPVVKPGGPTQSVVNIPTNQVIPNTVPVSINPSINPNINTLQDSQLPNE